MLVSITSLYKALFTLFGSTAENSSIFIKNNAPMWSLWIPCALNLYYYSFTLFWSDIYVDLSRKPQVFMKALLWVLIICKRFYAWPKWYSCLLLSNNGGGHSGCLQHYLWSCSWGASCGIPLSDEVWARFLMFRQTKMSRRLQNQMPKPPKLAFERESQSSVFLPTPIFYLFLISPQTPR